MSSAMQGSEEAMAEVALEELSNTRRANILVGGLGLGFTLRATLEVFGPEVSICVAELMSRIIYYNQTFLGADAADALSDPRVQVFEGDVRSKFRTGLWDAILMDVDNGPSALSVRSNETLYNARGVQQMAQALKPGGVLVVWSAFRSEKFLQRLRAAGLCARSRTIRARWPLAKGPKHTLFIANAPKRTRNESS